jgi:tRNA threonylcarbamoyladenosine biosynthesis protein TsaB
MSEDEPRLLILETSGRVGQVAVASGPILRAVRRLDEARRHARDLSPAVALLLTSQGWSPRDVHAVIVSRGPGSYTGLRVGIMSAKAFAYATGCALVAVDTFEVIARQAPTEATALHVIADAQQGKVYVQGLWREHEESGWSPLAPLEVRDLDTWLAERRPEAWVTGPGLRAYDPRLPASLTRVPPERWEPLPETLLDLGLARYRAGQRDDLWTLEPLYLRPSSAEEKWQARESVRKEGREL